jgi:hypothetical protein
METSAMIFNNPLDCFEQTYITQVQRIVLRIVRYKDKVGLIAENVADSAGDESSV